METAISQRGRIWNLKESDVDYNWHHGERGSTHEEITKRLRNEKLGLWCSVTDDRIGSYVVHIPGTYHAKC